MSRNYGWAGSVGDFLAIAPQKLVDSLIDHSYGDLSKIDDGEQQKIIRSQIKAWEDSIQQLKRILQPYASEEMDLVFEYEILRGSGRRPDVLILYKGYLLVVECKSFNEITASECIQTSLYIRDLQHYHSNIHQSQTIVKGTLLLTQSNDRNRQFHEFYQISRCTPHSFSDLLQSLQKHTRSQTLTLSDLLNGEYEPSPSMIEAARSIYSNEHLPKVKALASSNFEEVLKTTEVIIEEAMQTNTHHLILISGVPGAGKTFLGLEIAHKFEKAVYLSGNKPLIDVLQDALNNKTFVQGLYGYKMNYLERKQIPNEQIIIFDEAQRAWDAQKVDQYLKKIPAQHLSEPDIIIKAALTNKPWSVTIGLIGEGQEIYSGEEGGLSLWNDAIANQDITVHAKHQRDNFPDAIRFNEQEHLHLNCSLRAHAALNYYTFTNSLLEGDFQTAERIVESLPSHRYNLMITRDLDKAKKVTRNLYPNDTKTYGILCASGADRQKEVSILPRDKFRYNEIPNAALYFNHPESQYYSNTLNYCATEFQTQGLELDTAILHWDDDLYLENDVWKTQHHQFGLENPHQIKKNAYRVNLTRGRDGTIIYIPPKEILDETWHTLKEILKIPVL